MNDARETLQHQLADLRTKINSAMSESYDHELQVTRAMDRFEQLLSEYTVQAHQIGLMRPLTSDVSAMPASALGPDGVDYALDLDLRLEDVGEIQAAAKRMRQSIRPALHVMADGVRKESEKLAHSQIALEDEYDRLAQAVERQREEAKTLEMRLKVVSDQAESEKAVSHSALKARSRLTQKKLQADTAETNTTVAKLETEVVAVSAASEQGVVNAQGELDRKRIE